MKIKISHLTLSFLLLCSAMGFAQTSNKRKLLIYNISYLLRRKRPFILRRFLILETVVMRLLLIVYQLELQK
jgi:hypothetical protein